MQMAQGDGSAHAVAKRSRAGFPDDLTVVVDRFMSQWDRVPDIQKDRAHARGFPRSFGSSHSTRPKVSTVFAQGKVETHSNWRDVTVQLMPQSAEPLFKAHRGLGKQARRHGPCTSHGGIER